MNGYQDDKQNQKLSRVTESYRPLRTLRPWLRLRGLELEPELELQLFFAEKAGDKYTVTAQESKSLKTARGYCF